MKLCVSRRRLVAALLTCFLLAPISPAQPWCYNCAPGCWMTTWSEWYDPYNPLCFCPAFAYCTWTGICTNCFYGGMVYCVMENCTTYYQGTFATNCGCGEMWAGLCGGQPL